MGGDRKPTPVSARRGDAELPDSVSVEKHARPHDRDENLIRFRNRDPSMRFLRELNGYSGYFKTTSMANCMGAPLLASSETCVQKYWSICPSS